MIYLYLKTHLTTGKKYLGKTIQDPYAYLGSGKLWRRHIKKHGENIHTEILFESHDPEEIKSAGLYYSLLWNVVDSENFCNMMIEYGDGGPTYWKRTEEYWKKNNMSKRGVKRRSYSEEHRKSLSKGAKKYLSDPNNLAAHNKRLQENRNRNIEKVRKSISKLKWCNDGIRNYRKEVIPSHFYSGRLKHV